MRSLPTFRRWKVCGYFTLQIICTLQPFYKQTLKGLQEGIGSLALGRMLAITLGGDEAFLALEIGTLTAPVQY